ncbi:MAG: 50S ribosomal protein L29 [bacterium]|nr:50S ribosomal protein L29 [bacterium]
MKKKDLEKLKNKPGVELKEDLKNHKEKLWKLKVDLGAGKVKNVREIRDIKRTAAVISTILNQHGK